MSKKERHSQELLPLFETLRKALGYTVSVVVQALPDAGFAWLAQLAGSPDRDVLWIARQNLNKSRLVRESPDQVARLTSL